MSRLAVKGGLGARVAATGRLVHFQACLSGYVPLGERLDGGAEVCLCDFSFSFVSACV